MQKDYCSFLDCSSLAAVRRDALVEPAAEVTGKVALGGMFNVTLFRLCR
jgi:hypothetical protein